MARHQPPSLRRRVKPVREPKLALTIYCEGANTEPKYFITFAKDYGNNLVSVNTVGAAGTPMTIVRRAVEDKKARSRKKRNSFEEKDQIWVAFDCDEHPHVEDAIKIAEDCGVEVAFSNPCFEIWPIVHLVAYSFQKPTHRHDAQKLLKELMPKYDPKGAKILDYELMKPKFEAACAQAESMEKSRHKEGDPKGNPYTGVYRLMRLIQDSGRLQPKAAAISTV